MNTAVIIDLVTAAVLLAFLAFGARRGLLRSVAGLVIALAALLGAGLAASGLTPCAASLVQPVIERRVEARIDAALAAGADTEAAPPVPSADGSAPAAGEADASAEAVDRLLGLLKLEDVDSVADGAKARLREAGVSLSTAVAQSVAETVLHALIFVLSYILLLFLLHLVFRALDLMAKLPGLHFANRLGGAAFGLAEGALAVFLTVWLLRRFGVAFETPAVEATVLLRFFSTHTPLDMLSFL